MLSRRFLARVSGFISSAGLPGPGSRLLVGLSGGADSVCLLLALRDLGCEVDAAHCNFRLRGEESDRDEAFCRDLCRGLGVGFHVARFDTRGFARERSVSIEMAARDLRYSYFESLRRDLGAEAVCVAHHRDDSVETVLMNLIRGTGMQGLSGIRPRNGHVVRPFLCLWREEIVRELDSVGQAYVTDSSNLVDDVVRNKVRLGLLPLMREVNPSASASVFATSERVAEVWRAFGSVMEREASQAVSAGEGGAIRISLAALESSVSPGSLLFHILRDLSFTPAQVEQAGRMARSGPGKVLASPTHRLLVDRGSMVVEPIGDDAPRSMVMPECGLYALGDGQRFRVEVIERDGAFAIGKERDRLYADAGKVRFPLEVRTARRGDRFVPFGMRGSRLVSDYLTDRKVNLFDKRRQLVVTDADGNVVWLVGHRADDRFRVTPSSRSILVVTRLAAPR